MVIDLDDIYNEEYEYWISQGESHEHAAREACKRKNNVLNQYKQNTKKLHTKSEDVQSKIMVYHY